MSHIGNEYFQLKKPWNSSLNPDVEMTVSLSLNLVYLLSLVLQPFMPTAADEIRQQLNAQGLIYALENAFRCYLPAGHKIGPARCLFKKLEKTLINEYSLRFSGQRT